LIVYFLFNYLLFHHKKYVQYKNLNNKKLLNRV